MIFCETWLNDTMDNNLLLIPGYSSPIRHDRLTKRGGGVCIYSKEEVICRQINEVSDPPNFVECVWSVLPACKLIILAMYAPPNLHVAQQSQVIDYIISQADTALNLLQNSTLVLAGDLNQLPTSAIEQTLSLRQRVKIPTRGTSILDKVLVDESLCEDYGDPIVGPNFGNTDHLSVFLRPHAQQTNAKQMIKVFDYRESNIAVFLEKLKLQPWHHLYRSNDSIDTKCNLFYNFVTKAQASIPFNYVVLTSKDKPWITPVLKLLINHRYEAYRSGRNFPSKDGFPSISDKMCWVIRFAKISNKK